MSQGIEHIITPADLTHGGLGFIAVINGIWLEHLNPIVQISLSIGGLVYLYFMILAKYTEWQQRKRDLAKK